MDMRRLFLFLIFSFSLVLLWSAWTRQNQPLVPIDSTVAKDPSVPAEMAKPIEHPVVSNPEAALKAPTGKEIVVTTDIFKIEINTAGGNIQRLDLLKHKDAIDKSKPLTLLEQNGGHIYVAQSGLLGKGLPNHNADFSAESQEFHLAEGKDSLEVRLTALDTGEVSVTKVYTFHRGSYLVDVAYEIANHGNSALTSSAYFQLVRDSVPIEGSSKFVPTFTGPAVYTEQEKFQKITFSDIDKKKIKLPANPDNGWIGMLQHYFVSAWLPAAKGAREFYAKKLDGDVYSAGVILPVASIEPGKTGQISASLYAGPAQTKLDEIAPGLGLTVDYGWLTIFSHSAFLAHVPHQQLGK